MSYLNNRILIYFKRPSQLKNSHLKNLSPPPQLSPTALAIYRNLHCTLYTYISIAKRPLVSIPYSL